MGSNYLQDAFSELFQGYGLPEPAESRQYDGARRVLFSLARKRDRESVAKIVICRDHVQIGSLSLREPAGAVPGVEKGNPRHYPVAGRWAAERHADVEEVEVSDPAQRSRNAAARGIASGEVPIGSQRDNRLGVVVDVDASVYSAFAVE